MLELLFSGGIVASVFSHILYKNYDLTMFMNGVLGGLVAITAGADQMSTSEAMIIGAVGGIIVVLAIALLEKLKLDDPVGAIAVHLFAGMWGTLAVGIFGDMASTKQFMLQLAGVGIVGAFCVLSALIIVLKTSKEKTKKVSKFSNTSVFLKNRKQLIICLNPGVFYKHSGLFFMYVCSKTTYVRHYTCYSMSRQERNYCRCNLFCLRTERKHPIH